MTSRSESDEEDELGNVIPSEETVETLCYVEQKRREEDDREGEVSETDWLGLFPASTELNTAASVWVNGLGRFELVGAPWPAQNARTGVDSHLEATLRRTAGGDDEMEGS